MDDYGVMNVAAVLFVVSFVIIVNWTLLQVTVAVLLNSFLSASQSIEVEEQEQSRAAKRDAAQVNHCLDPLLRSIVRDYTCEKDLVMRMQGLFQVIDGDGSGSISEEEFVTAFRKLNFRPQIHINPEDFAALTEDGSLCNDEGGIGPVEFENIMLRQMKFFIQRQLSDMLNNGNPSEYEACSLECLKLVMLEQAWLSVENQKLFVSTMSPVITEIKSVQEEQLEKLSQIYTIWQQLSTTHVECQPELSARAFSLCQVKKRKRRFFFIN